MIRYLPAALALAALAAGVFWVVSVVQERGELRLQLADARVSLASARAALAQAEESARVHRAYLDKAEEERAEWEALQRDLQSMEGRDAPLSDLLRSTAGRLYGP